MQAAEGHMGCSGLEAVVGSIVALLTSFSQDPVKTPEDPVSFYSCGFYVLIFIDEDMEYSQGSVG